MRIDAVLVLLAFGAFETSAERNIFRVVDSVHYYQNKDADSSAVKDEDTLLSTEGGSFWYRFLTSEAPLSMSMAPSEPSPTPVPSSPVAPVPLPVPSPASDLPTALPVAETPSVAPATNPTSLAPASAAPTTAPVAPPSILTPITTPPSVEVLPTTSAPTLETTSPTTAPSMMGAVPTSAPVSLSTLGDLVRDGENFQTLEALLDNTGLLSVLDTPGLNFTVFAPTDDAFASIDIDLVTKLQDPQWINHTVCVLTYHVVDGIVMSTDLISVGQTLETLEGSNITVTSLDPPTINDAEIVAADIQASNGVAHALGGVLLPACINETIVEYLSSNDDFSTLVELLDTTGLVELIDTIDSPLTIFAPTNEAFDSANLTLLGSSEELLRATLLSHAFFGNVYSNALVGNDEVIVTENAQDHTAFLSSTDDGSITVNSAATVTEPDILRSGGVIHVVDQVIVPLFVGDFVESLEVYTKGAHSFTILSRALMANDLFRFLGLQPDSTILPQTLLAPNNDVLSNDTALVDRLFDHDNWFYHNQELLLRHLVNSALSVDELIEAGQVEVANGDTLVISDDSTIDDTATIIEQWSDLRGVNGYVHSIDAVLIPPNQALTIIEFMQDNDFSTLFSLLQQTGLESTLNNDGPFSIFAPTNDAFEAIGIDFTTIIPEDQMEATTNLLLYHVLEGNQVFIEWEEGEMLETLQGDSVVFTSTTTPEPRYFINNVRIIPIVYVENGVFYTIESVLTLPDPLERR